MRQTSFHVYYTARLLDNPLDDDMLAPAFASSNIKIFPFQIAAAAFALRSPYQNVAILCDEAGMDSVSPFHLSIGEFQAALLSNNGTIYNRANFTDEALTTGFIIIHPHYYRILFSECFTYEQLTDTIKNCMVELPGRITYGEFCLTQNE